MKGKWIILALVVSVALNLGLIGFLVGAGTPPPHGARGGFDPTAGLVRLWRFLPEQRRQELLGDNGGNWRREFRRSWREMRHTQHDIHDALLAEPFELAKLEAALARFRDHRAIHESRGHAVFVDVASRLTAAERRRFVETMGRRHRGSPRAGGKRHRHRGAGHGD